MTFHPTTPATVSRSRYIRTEEEFQACMNDAGWMSVDRLFAGILAVSLVICISFALSLRFVESPKEEESPVRASIKSGYRLVSEIPDAAVFQARLQERYFAACVKSAAMCAAAASEQFVALKKGYCLGRSEFYGTASFPTAATQLEAYIQAPVDGAHDGMRGCTQRRQ